jgi:hypothetical protein
VYEFFFFHKDKLRTNCIEHLGYVRATSYSSLVFLY